MTEIGKLESYADGCVLAAYFLAGLATGIVLMMGHLLGVEDPEWIAVVTIGVIGLAFLWLDRYIWKKIESIEMMESTEGDGE